jgi:hypothetical protein
MIISLMLVSTAALTTSCLRRAETKGCFTFAYVGLVIVCINVLTFASWMRASSVARDVYSILTSGQTYSARVIETVERTDSDSCTENDKATVRFVTQSERTADATLGFSCDLKIGDICKINYNEEKRKAIRLDFNFVMSIGVWFLMVSIFTMRSVGILLYALRIDTGTFSAVASKYAFVVLGPFVMVSFTALLFYALLSGNDVPFLAKIMIGFFILVMTLGTLIYLKLLITLGAPKFTRVGIGKWESGWEQSASAT